LVDGSIVAKNVERHTHPIAEELRWQVTETGVIQAKGRARALRRKESCWMDILNDVVLPGTVNEAVDWKKDVKPGAEADMAAAGVILTNNRDARKAFGLSKDDAEAVRNCPAFSIDNLYRKTRTVISNGAIEKRTPVRSGQVHLPQTRGEGAGERRLPASGHLSRGCVARLAGRKTRLASEPGD
jgi:hypothetical protein